MNIAVARAEARAACSKELPIAPEPHIWNTPGTEHIASATSWDLPAIMDFMDQHGTEPRDLESMAIYTYPQASRFTAPAAFLDNHPKAIEDQIYFPVIGIGVPEDGQLSQFWTNLKLRHELRHIMQNSETNPPYDRRWALNTARAVGTMALAYATKGCYDLIQDTTQSPDVWATILAGSLGAGTALNPKSFLHTLSPTEIDARIFSYRTVGFNPVQVSKDIVTEVPVKAVQVNSLPVAPR
jgi:hypothetical protein